MLETVEYRKKLPEVLTEIKAHFDIAEIRGSSVGSFIFAKKRSRAIEIYQSDSFVIAEFWVDENQETEIEANSYREAINLVFDWINKNNEK